MSSNALAKTEFTQEQLQVIETQFFPAGATKTEQEYCFAVARELGLNPILKEIHFVPRRAKVGDRWINKIEPMVGRDGFLSLAHCSGQLAGIETSASVQDIPTLEDGRWITRPQLVATCTVWRKDSDKPFTAQVAYNEYCQRTSEGQATKFWSEKPETMLKKVSESQVLRKAFNICGAYAPEELGSGFETETGEIINEIEVVGNSPSRSHLAIAGPTPTHEVDWPEPPAPKPDTPSHPQSSGTNSGAAGITNIIDLLESRSIPFEIDHNAGVISARSYDERQLLKDNGFRWHSDSKSWQFTFDTIPF